MVIVQRRRTGRKPTGGRYTQYRGKRNFEAGSEASLPRVGAVETQVKKLRGGGEKTHLVQGNVVNLFDPKTKKYTKATAKIVTDNKANRQFVRRNVLTKGSVIETDKGKARVTNRPGQEGSINAVLVH